MEVVNNTYLPGDPRLIDHIVYELKAQGIFDNLRKECIADVDTKPAYQNLRQRVEGSVSGFLKSQKWRSDMNKNQVREMLRKNISESGFLETGVERIVDQVVNPKINTIFLPQVENVVYKVLGIQNPSAFDNLKNEDKKNNVSLDLLPNDLEAISPESESQEKKMDVSNDSQKLGNKVDEDESPAFEPIDQPVLHEENSVDSNLSGISGLMSHESNHSVENGTKEVPPAEVSNPDSSLSKQSSDDTLSAAICEEQEVKMEINADCNASKVSSTKVTDTITKSVDAPDSQSSFDMMEITSSTEKVEEVKNVEEKRSPEKKVDKHHSSHRHSSHKSKHDGKDRKNDKDRKSDKDKRDHHSSSRSGDSSSRKDKDRKINSDKDPKHNESKSNKEKDRDRTSSSHKHSKEKSSKRDSHESKNKESSGHKDSKTRTSSESKSKESKDNKDDRSRSQSSSKKSKDDRSHSKHNGKSKSDSSDPNKTKDIKKSDRSDKKDKHSHSSDKKNDKGDKDKKGSRKDVRKDDHYSLKEKRTHRRSTDRDSSDGQSGTHSSSSSLTDLNTPSQLQKSSQESSMVDSGASTGTDSGTCDAILSLLSQKADITSIPCIVSAEENARLLSNKVTHLKLIKPKCASNIFEARRLMKIRKKLCKLEKQTQMELLGTNSSMIASVSNSINHKLTGNISDDHKSLLKNKKNSTKSIIDVEENEIEITQKSKAPEAANEEMEPPAEEETILQTSVISKESWDAIEAKLNAQNILKVDYNSYIDSSENVERKNEAEPEPETLANASERDTKMANEYGFKGFTNKLIEEAEHCLKMSCETITHRESELAKLSKAYLIDLAEKDKSRMKRSSEEFNDFNRLPKIEIVDVTSNNEIIFSPGRGIKRIANDHTDVHNNNKISKELGDVLSEKLNEVAVSTPKHKSKKSKLIDSSVNTLDNFNLPLSPADSEKSFNSVNNEKRNEASETRPKRTRAVNRQRYSSDDLYKPRMQFTSTRRRTTNSDKN